MSFTEPQILNLSIDGKSVVKLLLIYFLAPSWNSCEQDIFAVRHFWSPWHLYPFSSVLLSSHGSSEQIRCSSSTTASGMYQMPVVMEGGRCRMGRVTDMDEVCCIGPGDLQALEEIWEDYFSCPSHWWDNRIQKVSTTLSQWFT